MIFEEANYRDSALFRRRSIRRFKDEKPQDWQVKAILEAAMCTQSACNQMPFELILVDDRAILDKLQAVLPFSRLKTAPLAIVVISQRNWKVKLHPCGMFIQQDLAAVSHQICLAATEIGLGACWCGLYPAKPMANAAAKALGIPSDVMPLSIIPIGIPNEDKAPNVKWMPEKVRKNAY
jgi:nitroreductase